MLLPHRERAVLGGAFIAGNQPSPDLSHNFVDLVRLQKTRFLCQFHTPSHQDLIRSCANTIAFISNRLDRRFPVLKTHRFVPYWFLFCLRHPVTNSPKPTPWANTSGMCWRGLTTQPAQWPRRTQEPASETPMALYLPYPNGGWWLKAVWPEGQETGLGPELLQTVSANPASRETKLIDGRITGPTDSATPSPALTKADRVTSNPMPAGTRSWFNEIVAASQGIGDRLSLDGDSQGDEGDREPGEDSGNHDEPRPQRGTGTYPAPSWRLFLFPRRQLQLCGGECVVEEHGDRQRADAAGDGRDLARHFLDGVEIDVPH